MSFEHKKFDYLTTSLNGPLLIEASAGTGKTFSLEKIISRLVLEGGEDGTGIDIDRILVVTFMNDAASELKMRIRKTLIEYLSLWDKFLADCDIEGKADALFQSWQQKAQSTDEKTFIREKLANACRMIDMAPIYTIHGFAKKLLTEFSLSCGEFAPRRIADGGELESLKEFVFDEFIRKRLPKNDPELLSEILSFQNWKDGFQALYREKKETRQRIRVEPLLDNKNPLVLTEKAAEWFRQCYIDFPDVLALQKRRRNLMTFDDVLLELLDHLQKTARQSRENKETFIDAIRTKYRAVLIDEFQDTDPVQYEIFKILFFDPATSQVAPSKNIFFVGDPKQAIYSFRSAEIETYFAAKSDIQSVETLTTNYRSTAELVKTVNLFFSSSDAFLIEKDKDAFYTQTQASQDPVNPPLYFVPHESNTPVPLKAFEIWTTPGDAAHRLSRTDQGKQAPSSHEATAIANDIASLLNGNVNGQQGIVYVYWGTKKQRPIRPGDFAVIVRKNSTAAEIAKELKKHRIRSCLPAKESVFSQSEAVDVLCLLQAVLDPECRQAFNSAAATALVGYSLKELSEERVASNLRELFSQIRKDLPIYGIYAVFLRLMRETDPTKGFGTIFRMLNEENTRALINLQHILELIETAQKQTQSLSGLVAWLTNKTDRSDLATDEDLLRPDNNPSLVNIVTIHKSKGLEYPVVYLAKAYLENAVPSGDQNVFRELSETNERQLLVSPQKQSTKLHGPSAKRAQEEALRMAYVAMTRASHRLVLPLAFSITTKGNFRNYKNNSYLLAFSKRQDKSSTDPMDDLLSAFTQETRPIQDLAASRIKLKTDFYGLPEEKLPNCQKQAQRLERDWTYSSFTTLSKSLVENHAFGESGFFSFPSGASAGTFLHKAIETALIKALTLSSDELSKDDWLIHHLNRFFDRNMKGTIQNEQALVPDPAVGISWETSAENYCRQWMLQVFTRLFRTPLVAEGDTLIDLVRRRRLVPEIDFLESITNKNFTVLSIENAFKNSPTFSFLIQGNDDETKGEEACLLMQQLNGFLSGQIDLIFQDQSGRYWILDWKSNKIEDPSGVHSRDFPGNYTQEAMERVMQGSNYKLQALCYLTALKRHLTAVFGSSEEAFKHIGGAVYVFLRGIGEPGNPHETGLYKMPATEELIDAVKRLDSAFTNNDDSSQKDCP